MTIPARQALADRANRPDELIASGRQVEMVFKPGQKALSLRASKVWHLLVKATGLELASDKMHRLNLADLYQAGLGHMTLAERVSALDELQTTLVQVRVPSTKVPGRMRVISGPLLSNIERDEDDRGELAWEFSRALRSVFANSDHWAVLSKRAVMAFESRYSLRLYEILALRSGLDRKTREVFPLDELRARLGVPQNSLNRWVHLQQRALAPAIAEVNQLAGFYVDYEPLKKGRSVIAVALTWGEKNTPERRAAKRELDGSKAGRKARRNGTTEQVTSEPIVPTEFPTSGSIHYTAFAPIAKGALPYPQQDMDIVAEGFREWARKGNRPLKGPNVITMWDAFCRKQPPTP